MSGDAGAGSQPALATLATWEAEGTTVGEVEAAIDGLRRREERAAVRMAVLTLVALVEADRSSAALEVVQELGAHHPATALLLVAGPAGAEPRLDAEVSVHVGERGERGVCFETLLLRVQGPAVGHLDSVVEPFLLPDLPVVVWLPGRLPALSDPLLASASRVLVDTKELGDAAAFPDLVALGRRLPVTDLSWVRLAPWRELLAGLFEGSPFRPFLQGVRGVRVAGKAGPRHLLAGWVMSRLDLPRSVMALEEALHVSIEMDAEHEGRAGRFSVVRHEGERTVQAAACIEGGPSHSRTLRLRERSPARVLGQALARLGHDRVYEGAVAAAVELT